MIRRTPPSRRTAPALAAAALATASLLAALASAPGASADESRQAPPAGSGPACAFYDGDRPTSLGERGERVSQAQCLLANRHYLRWSDVDGTFGPETLVAVQRFQADHPPLVPDGRVTPATWSALWHAGPNRVTPLPFP
ncbi:MULTISPECIES: peptidoglycan-binding protein [unclassified Streptomyces]|jgi:peptidoglycan hydrolase-like protein with peptidoglycan-binding domain|uniref:peptidoglycan-binding domain-containing protein n=1 Tax=unclassified Streptomyces TaxID=2593676 RepID=UPI00081B3BF9|nr:MULTISPECIES: peptidoglycan-binding protein [unclassified Streptomyces]MEE1749768.1 peptidoglycan-binding protein [Streptomyces sp. JV184]MYQ88080.1 peptidoglycan-binding protein [Streptomyces sp. SID4936]SCE52263.1 Putative peptidoglycan binding domain-containing protein [Streptomyces sp. DvalAA-43]